MAHGEMTLAVPVDKADEVGVLAISEEDVEDLFEVLAKRDVASPPTGLAASRTIRKTQERRCLPGRRGGPKSRSARSGQGLSAGEKSLYTKARNVLVSELAFALDVDEEAAMAKVDGALVKGSAAGSRPDCVDKAVGVSGKLFVDLSGVSPFTCTRTLTVSSDSASTLSSAGGCDRVSPCTSESSVQFFVAPRWRSCGSDPSGPPSRLRVADQSTPSDQNSPCLGSGLTVRSAESCKTSDIEGCRRAPHIPAEPLASTPAAGETTVHQVGARRESHGRCRVGRGRAPQRIDDLRQCGRRRSVISSNGTSASSKSTERACSEPTPTLPG